MTDIERREARQSELSHEMAETIESLRAAMGALRARVDSAERQLAGALAAQAAVSSRIERLAAELDHSQRLGALTEQLEALRRAREADADTLASVSSRLGRLDRLEQEVGQLRSTSSADVENAKRELRSEVAAVSERSGSDGARAAVELQGAIDRLDALAAELSRIDTLERQQRESAGAINTLTETVREAREERLSTEEAFSRSEQRMAARVDGLADQIAEEREEVAEMLSRIENQTETVRESRAIAARSERLAEQLRSDHHASAEAQRVAEGRVESTLSAMRDEIARAWELFRSERSNERQADAAADAQRDEQLSELGAQLDSTFELIAAAERALGLQEATQSEALLQLRRDVTDVLLKWRELLASAVDDVALGLPPHERPAVAAERREATRKALRAPQSDAGE
ncbi:MAG: hypothetical protein ACK2T6_01645 [Anaerolineae bacterium]